MDKTKIRFKWIRFENKLKQFLGLPEGASWDYIFDVMFDKLAIMQQPPEAKAEISQRVSEGVKTTKLYWIELILAALVATFGLLQNSVAVIIGAMLIAPLLRPIQGLAYSIVLGRAELFARGLKLLSISVLVSILTPMIVLFFLSGVESTDEILARTQPNLIDLLIAIFSAIIAILAHAYKRLYESVAGVAMATALMPPLVVIGIELFWGNMDLAWGATLLFITNLVAILVVGTILFIFYGFNPHRSQTESSLGKIAFLLVVTLGLWILLSFNLGKIQQQRVILEQTRQSFESIIEVEMPGARIKNLTLRQDEDVKTINGTFYVPESVSLTRAKFNQIESQLSEVLGEDVYLELDLIRTVSFDRNN